MKRKIKTGYNINPTDFTITYNYEEFDIECDYFLSEECKKLAREHTIELTRKATIVDFEVARFLQENPLYKIKT